MAGLSPARLLSLVPAPEVAPNPHFSNWSGGLPVGWSVFGATGGNTVTEISGGGIRIVSLGNNVGINVQSLLTINMEYILKFRVIVAGGSMRVTTGQDALGPVISATGDYSYRLRAYTSRFEIKRNIACDVSIIWLSLRRAL